MNLLEIVGFKIVITNKANILFLLRKILYNKYK